MKNLFLSIVALFATASISAQTVTNLNDSGPGSLRGEILAASPGDVISLSPSLLANGSDTLTLQSDIIINKGLTIQGINTATDTLYINGGKHTRLFYVDITGGSNRHLKFKNLTLINGRDTVSTSDGHGGALLVLNADSVTIEDCHFEGNENNNGGDGGACHITGAHVKIVRSSFVRNRISNCTSICLGGGVYIYQGSTFIDSSSFRGQTSEYDGAGLFVWDSPLRCLNSEFIKNRNLTIHTTTTIGGAIFSWGEKVFIDKCIFKQNEAGSTGSAVDVWKSANDVLDGDSVTNCLFEANRIINSSSAGGTLTANRMYVSGSSFINNISASSAAALFCRDCELVNSTISGNTSTSDGVILVKGDCLLQNVSIVNNSGTNGVITYSLFNSPIDTVTIKGCIIAGNSSPDGVHNVYLESQGYNVLYDSPSSAQPTDIVGVTSGLNMEPLAMNGGLYPTHIPMVNSPAYNAGDSTDFSPAQNGPIFGRRDIGAAERGIISYDTTLVCGNITWWGNNYNMPGTYSDTAYNPNSIDSVGVLVLYSQDTSIENRNATLVALEQSQGTSYQWVDCANGYSPIAGATDSTFLPTANGSYAVVLTNGSCSDTSDCINYNEVGIKEQSTTPLLTFYPNPTSGSLTLYSPNELPNQLQVLDLSGRTISTIKVSNNEIQLPALTVGIYLLKWEFEGGVVQVDRVVVE
ncbi:T9SS type A sorting domain-containing protein [Phaeocystidibacter luteus]|uniref:T9SS type A sorting domain-containing protein n=1 Tax=Phaeocystidibacter luteus TaxID=911197 RepID=A0A6N6RIU3_9FLAO|nr:T9SS type A sorting domain-containing protein [Phaeocystidibacter luteus]KAB2805369.1 T9SS type A sorting domain-containing protein [Phaeocystidibacter luteus]